MSNGKSRSVFAELLAFITPPDPASGLSDRSTGPSRGPASRDPKMRACSTFAALTRVPDIRGGPREDTALSVVDPRVNVETKGFCNKTDNHANFARLDGGKRAVRPSRASDSFSVPSRATLVEDPWVSSRHAVFH